MRIKFTLLFVLLMSCLLMVNAQAAQFKQTQLQYIVALGDPAATSGNNAQTWGLWDQDPGPRGCRLDEYANLKRTGIAPANWKFDEQDWWLEEHGLMMEKPTFPLAPVQYVVTGGREVTSVLTVYPPAKDGAQRWELANGAKLYDVTHLPCHAARYTPATQGECTPAKASQAEFPVAPGVAMPAVNGCKKQDYAVLFVIAVAQ